MTRVFVSFNDPTKGLIQRNHINFFGAIHSKDEIQSSINAKAHGFVENLQKLEKIITAEVYLHGFSQNTTIAQPELLTLQNMLNHLLGNIDEEIRENFRVL